jgi:hypothetical protein
MATKAQRQKSKTVGRIFHYVLVSWLRIRITRMPQNFVDPPEGQK